MAACLFVVTYIKISMTVSPLCCRNVVIASACTALHLSATLILLPNQPLQQGAAANQTSPCRASSRSAWVLRATDPDLQHANLPSAEDLPEPAIFLQSSNGSCNSYLPSTNGLGQLLWTVQYLVASGFYVAVRVAATVLGIMGVRFSWAVGGAGVWGGVWGSIH